MDWNVMAVAEKVNKARHTFTHKYLVDQKKQPAHCDKPRSESSDC